MGWVWVEKFNLYFDMTRIQHNNSILLIKMGHRDRVRDRDKGGGNVNVI